MQRTSISFSIENDEKQKKQKKKRKNHKIWKLCAISVDAFNVAFERKVHTILGMRYVRMRYCSLSTTIPVTCLINELFVFPFPFSCLSSLSHSPLIYSQRCILRAQWISKEKTNENKIGVNDVLQKDNEKQWIDFNVHLEMSSFSI